MRRLSILIGLAMAGALTIAPAANASLASNAQELESIVAASTSAGAVMPAAGRVGTIQAPLPGSGSSSLGERNNGTTPGSNQGSRKSLRRSAPKPRIRCLVNGKTGPMTCTYYRSGKAYKRCHFATHKLKNVTCHTLAHRSASARGAVGAASSAAQGPLETAASIKWQGFPTTPLSQVGKIFEIKGGQWYEQCSGTLITASLVLTAGHCVYDISTHSYFDALYFVPGGSYNASAGAVKMNEPYGVWKGYAWWTTGRYQTSGDSGLDWGLIELQPENGVFPGRALGSFQAYYGLSWPVGTRVYEVGYPASGIWRGSNYFEGRTQYACDTTFDSYAAQPSGYGLYSLCSMNGGASGGPWFRNINGTWVVAGINDLCTPKTDEVEGCAPYSTQLISNYFDNRFGTFFNSIVPSRLHF
jgi:V8-like Glu-specific endopeptidase